MNHGAVFIFPPARGRSHQGTNSTQNVLFPKHQRQSVPGSGALQWRGREAEAERAARRHADERAAAAAAEAAEARRGAEDRIARLEKSLAEAEGSRRVLLERTESLAARAVEER